MRVLILGGRAPVALDLARRFADAGHAALVADSVPCRLAGASRCVEAMLPRLPAPRTHLADYAAALARLVREQAIDVLLPTCEEVFYVSRVRSKLPTHCEIFVPPFCQLEQLHSKQEALRIAAELGIRVPESACVQTIEEAREWSRGRGVVLKPEFSRFGTHVRRYPTGIPDGAPPLVARGRWIVQRYCIGRELCSYAIAVQGTSCLNVCYEPVWRLGHSSSYYFEARRGGQIDEHVTRFVEHLGYHGQISFDWFVEPDGIATMIECNPRATSGVHLLPEDAPVPGAMLDGTRYTFDAAIQRPRMLAPVMLTAGLARAIAGQMMPQWWRDWRRADDVLTRAGDRASLVGAVRDLAAFSAMARQQGCSLREVSTRDIEWDGEILPE